MTRHSTGQTVLSALRLEGETLTLAFEDGRPVWRLLSSGRRISPRTARHIINSVGVQSCGDTLFPDAPAQTYRAR